MKGNRLIWILLAVVVVFAIAAYVRGKSSKDRNKTEVKVEKVNKRKIIETVTASGRIFPEEELGISSDVSGEIMQLLVKEGDTVRAGQLLAQIDKELYLSQIERLEAVLKGAKASALDTRSQSGQFLSNLDQAKAQVQQIDAQIENAQLVLVRAQQLFDEGITAKAELESAQASLKSLEANRASAFTRIAAAESTINSGKERVNVAQSNIESAEANLREAKKNLSRTRIVAPVNGVISKLNLKKGERVVGTSQMSGTEIMRIANMASMEVQVDVSENDIIRVKLGDTATIEVDAYPEKTFLGVVTQIANSANNTGITLTTDQITNFTVKIRMLPSSYNTLAKAMGRSPFLPGMSASADIKTLEILDVLSVPIQAVTTREEEDSDNVKETELKEVVFVFQQDSVAMKEVKTGIQDDSYIQVLSGLSEDDEIVIGPYSAVSRKLEDGTGVKKEDPDKKKKKKRFGK